MRCGRKPSPRLASKLWRRPLFSKAGSPQRLRSGRIDKPEGASEPWTDPAYRYNHVTMADDQAGPSKDELERQKLLLEIAALKRLPWRWTPILTSFLPSLTVALVSVGVGWWTGFFDIQRLALEAQRHNLENLTRQLRAEERDLLDKKTGLVAQISQLEATSAADRKKADAEREQLRAKLAADLRDERTKADKDKAALKRTVDETREAVRRTPAVVWLDVMTRKKESWERMYASHAADELLKLMSGDPSLVPFVAAQYEKHSADDFVAAKLLRILYVATGDARWLERIAAKLGEAPKAAGPVGSLDLLSLSGLRENYYWNESAFLRLGKRDLPFLERVLKVASGDTGDSTARGAIVISLGNSFDGELDRRAFSAEESYFALLRLARDHALMRSYSWLGVTSVYMFSYARQEALKLVGRLSAEAAITIFAILIVEQERNRVPILVGTVSGTLSGTVTQYSSERAQLESDFRYRMTEKAFRAEAVRLGLVSDSSDELKWEAWLRDHSDLVAEWTERDLAKVRQRLSGKSSP